VLCSFLQHDGLPFADALPEEQIQRAFAAAATFADDDEAVYTPSVTLWAFLSQVLFKGEMRSCLAAVGRVIVLCVALGRRPCSDNTGAYCRARAKLPVAVIRRLVEELADACEDQLPRGWLWMDRHGHLIDGSTVSLPDTEANQAEYSQANTQEPGLGFPIARLVVLFSWASAMLQGMALGPYAGKETGETALLRELFDRLRPGNLVLADRYYCSYFMVALLQEKGLEVVLRQHQLRTTDFRRGQRLGPGDHSVTGIRPARPDWMDQQTYERIPETLVVREVQVQVHQPGFRVESLVVVTTLLDAARYTKDDIAELYHQRWLVELDIRALKISLGIDVLRYKDPEMVRREIGVALLAYNLIRRSMLQAAVASESDRSPRQLSFTAAMQKVAASWNTLTACAATVLMVLIAVHLKHMASHEIGHRPDRVEPRAVKRRPKPHKLLTKPRKEAQAELLAGVQR
jgi:hypothetical protein